MKHIHVLGTMVAHLTHVSTKSINEAYQSILVACYHPTANELYMGFEGKYLDFLDGITVELMDLESPDIASVNYVSLKCA